MSKDRLVPGMALAVLSLMAACHGGDEALDSMPLGVGQKPVVYGEDNRTDYYAHTDDQLKTLTRESIVALIPPSNLDQTDPSDVRIVAPTLGEDYGLCTNQRFFDQPTAAWCSATLIDNDLVLTAGHCVTSDSECRDVRYVFDYYYESEGRLATISSDDIYECEQLVAQAYTSTVDYAIVQLDRPVTLPHRPAAVRLEEGALTAGDSVPVIGFGSGLPAKIDDGGHVVDTRAGTIDYFVATSDTFGGNSGSGVFNAQEEVVGILVRGETDYVYRNGCYVVNVLPEGGGGTGEDVTYVQRAIADLCEEVGWPSQRLCGGGGGDGWCDPCASVDDCPDGWSCRSWPDAPTVTWCSSPCSAEEACQTGHHCTASGRCEPDLVLGCSQGDVWTFDSCRNRLALSVDCAADELCADAACVDRMPGDTCDPPTIISAVDQTLTGNLASGYLDDYRGSCGGGGAERVYQLTLTESRRLVAQATGFDTLLYLRQECTSTASELVCNDDASPPGGYGSSIAANLEAGTYYLFMDAWNTNVGTYSLQLTFTDPTAVPDGDNCTNPTLIEPVSQTLTGNLNSGYFADTRGSCAGSGVERVYRFTLDRPHQMVAEATGFDTVLYLRSVCNDGSSQRVCNDDANPPGDYGSHIQADLDAGDYFLFMDAYGGTTGAYTLVLTLVPACTDACVEGDRECIEDGYRECVLDSGAGCTIWAQVVACGSEQICQDGECVAECTDPCEVGMRECAGQSWRECQEATNGCPTWSAATACLSNQVCIEGECQVICTNLCMIAERRCSNTSAYQECVVDASGCRIWGPPQACPDSTTCTASGECVSTCEDDGYEPNNNAQEAISLTVPEMLDLIACQDDDDWFAFELDEGYQVELTLAFDEDAIDLGLELYSLDTMTLIESSPGTEAGEENIVYATDINGEFVFRAFVESGGPAIYELYLTSQPVEQSLCQQGDRRCTPDGGGYQTCVELDGSELWVWSEVTLCDPSETCIEDGVCVTGDEEPGDMGDDATGDMGDDATGDMGDDMTGDTGDDMTGDMGDDATGDVEDDTAADTGDDGTADIEDDAEGDMGTDRADIAWDISVRVPDIMVPDVAEQPSPPADGCGCQSATGGFNPLGLLGIALMAWIRRSGRRPSQSRAYDRVGA